MRLARHFTLQELSCKCGNCETTVEDIASVLPYQLQRLRDAFGLPIHILSGYRCKAHNKAVGGAFSSQHRLGRAVDIDISHYNSIDLNRLIMLIYRMGAFTGKGIGSGKLHIDVRATSNPVTWLY